MKEAKKTSNIMGAVLSRPSKKMGVSLASQDIRGEIKFILVDLIIPFKNQARTIFDDKSISELSDSIKCQGVIQPLQVIPSQEYSGKYEVVSGERRLKASKIAGLERVPCIVLDKKKDFNLVSLIENIQRENLHPVDLANAIGDLVKDSKHGEKSNIALKLGMNTSLFSQYLTIFNLPKSVKSKLLNMSEIPFYHILNLSKLKTEDEMLSSLSKKVPKKKIISFLKVKFENENLSIELMNKNYLTKERREKLKNSLSEFIQTL